MKKSVGSMVLKHWLTEISAAPADLGTFLPLSLGLVAIAGMDPVGLLFGFGMFAIATALIYRRPIPVQPMKAVAAMGIAGLAGPEVLIATGCLMGLTLILLSQTNAIGWLKRLVPNTVLFGLRVALAISLLTIIRDLPGLSSIGLAGLLAILIVLLRSQLKALASVTTVLVGWTIFGDVSGIETLEIGFHWPVILLPTLTAMGSALETTFLPQLALTLTNALILTAVIAQDYFPDDRNHLTERNFALSSGVANFVLAPIGAMPMCHGAGGLAAYHGLGSKTGWSVAVFGFACLGGALLLGDQVVTILRTLPSEVLGVLLVYAAWALADPVKIANVRSPCQVIIVFMVGATLLAGPLIALIAGIAIELARARWFPYSNISTSD
ncbi:putative sulfate/molybdate transporter [Litoricolaceae bacterium]|nr:putative sulfate/molybdate transporter [Litorivicinaceae bacterium]